MLASPNELNPQHTIRIGSIDPQRAIGLFESCATDSDRRIFPNGVYDQCHQVFGAMQGTRLIGFVTVRDANAYYAFVKAKIDAIPREELLRFVNRVPLYDPDFLATQPTPVLQGAVIQITWIACGGRKGFQGHAHGVELFARFIDPAERSRGIGSKLLQSVIEQLAQMGKCPIRVLPTDVNRSYRGLSELARAHLEIINRDWFMQRLSA